MSIYKIIGCLILFIIYSIGLLYLHLNILLLLTLIILSIFLFIGIIIVFIIYFFIEDDNPNCTHLKYYEDNQKRQ